ncbi:MAG: hypothetical protein P8009_06380 [Gammaproteobacteria bacterium]|nr:hypothetical protein [Gammaproteobacteria bacterium]
MDAITRLQWEIAELEALASKYRDAEDEETRWALKRVRIQIRRRRDKLAAWRDVAKVPAALDAR